MELKECSVTVDGLTIHYRSGGTGPGLLLLHGFSLSGKQWDTVLSDFIQHFTVIVPDLPGHGRSTALDGPFSYRRTAQVILKILDQLDESQVYAIGHSAGAITTLHMAAKQPERIAAMGIIAGAHRMSISGRELLRNDKFESLDSDFQEFYRELHPGGDQQINRIFAQMNGLGDNYEDASLSPEFLATLPTPTLLVWGDQDPYFPLEFALEMHRALPESQLWVVPGQGHTPVWDSLGGSVLAARMFPEVIRKFFDEVPSH